MIKRFLFTLFAFLPMMMNAKGITNDAPDFAYPQRVIKDADKMLDEAFKKRDGQKVIEALIQSGLAQVSISPDSVVSVISRIEKVNATEKDEVTRSLLDILLADIYSAYYDDNSYNLDRRPELSEPGTDITLWSGKEFKEKIMQLYADALSHSDKLKEVSISDYSKIIEAPSPLHFFYPTLFDFASLKAIQGIKELSEGYSAGLLAPAYYYDTKLTIPNELPRSSRLAVFIADKWVDATHGAPHISALLQRYNLIAEYVITEDEDSQEKEIPLLKIYEENKGTPYAVELLLAADMQSLNVAQTKQVYNALKAFADAHPDYFNIESVNSTLQRLAKKTYRVKFPQQVAPGKEFEVVVELGNMPQLELMVYKVKESAIKTEGGTYMITDCNPTPVGSIILKSDSIIPFREEQTSKYEFDDYGVYVMASTLTKRTERLTPIYCSDLALIDFQSKQKMIVYTVDGTTGAPVSGAELTTYNSRRTPVTKLRTRVTKEDGAATIDRGDLRNILVKVTKGADKYSVPLNEYLNSYATSTKSMTAFLRTALAVYHPGDTLDFVTVVYNYHGNARELVKDTDFKAVLRNANYVEVDTIDIRTDEYGRAAGSFLIPDDGLTGQFSILITGTQSKKQIGWGQVMVSDYKLPTYEATVDSVIVNDDRSVTIIGKATAYSGFPIQNARVLATLSGIQRYYWSSNTVKFHTDTLTTDANGIFTWTLPEDVLKQTPFPEGGYQAEFIVTSQSGENRTCMRMFALGNEAFVTIETGGYIAAMPNSDTHITVIDAIGNPLDAELKLSFKSAGESVYDIDAVCRNGITKADLGMLHSGTYTLTVTTVGVEAKPATATVVVYNEKDSNSPVDKALWTPKANYTVDKYDRKASLVYGTSNEDTHILMTVFNKAEILSQKWITPRKGMNRINVSVPDTLDKVDVLLSTVRNFDEEQLTFIVKVDNPEDVLKVKVEHLRRNLTPLSQETITVKVTNGSGNGTASAVILDMYTKALDNIATQSWVFRPSSGYIPSISFSSNLQSPGYSYFNETVPYYSGSVLKEFPKFNFYGLSWTNDMVYEMAMPVMQMKRSALGDSAVYAVNEVKMESYDTSESAEVEDVAEEVSEDAGTVDVVEKNSVQEYRPSEIPLAFFAPMLTTDDKGNLTYSFTVPNANTTWVLNALGYNDNLATSVDICEVISSKPVMVEPNMPRFLRTGDKAVIRASVMNNSVEDATITTTFEVIDPVTGNTVDTQSQVKAIGGGKSETVQFAVNAPSTPGALMIRVKSSTEVYSDGVQNLLPILSSSQPVIESETFYLTPDRKEFSRELPAHAADATVTLSFCENPTWEVVSALPGLRSDDSKTSLAASAQIFAAAVSGYVIDLNPAIEPALKEWLSSAKDAGEMLSMLNHNDDLKQLYLAATPWVQQAQSDEERISRLAILFDRNEISRSISNGVTTLEKMQRDGGGWSWTADYDEPSEWVTLEILNNFAELRQLGCYPKELDKMVEKAVGYIDREVAKDYAKYPKGDYSFFAYVRSLYRDIPMPTGALKAYNATVQRTLKNWKKSRTPQKAADALLLYRSDYKAVAGEILNSLREFATSTPESGMWWESVDDSSWWSLTTVGQNAFILQAFNTIDPGCAEIDKIRQWLILNKIVQDWGTSVDASAIVASILQCGSSWLNRPGDAVVTIDGNKVIPDSFDKLTGQIIARVPDAKGTLEISRTVDGPAWGAVVEQSTQVMRDVKAHSIPELSITKELFVNTGAGWEATDNFSVGQVVKVRLVIKALRDMDYITVVDNRAATFEPVVQTPRPVYCDGLIFYLENLDDATNLFINHLPNGQYVIEYEMNVNNAGVYASGLATIQSQYTPEMTAHSSGSQLNVGD